MAERRLLEMYVRQLLESEAGPEVSISWQGGEPTLMSLDFFDAHGGLRRALQATGPDARLYHSNQRHAVGR